jgi:hypothetical protein
LVRIDVKWDFISPSLRVVSGTIKVVDINYSYNNKETIFEYKVKITNKSINFKAIEGKRLPSDLFEFIQEKVDLLVKSFFDGVILKNNCYCWLNEIESNEFLELNDKIIKLKEIKMSKKKIVECVKCGEQQLYECDSTSDIVEQTGFNMINGVWLCPNCLKDNYTTEGC